MTTKQAIKVLSDHQKWRMGDDNFQPTIPSQLSEALDIAINIMSKSEVNDNHCTLELSKDNPFNHKC